MGTLPDASVNGSIVGGDTSASFAAGATCFGGEPAGSIQGNIRTFTGMGTSNFTFNSSNAFVVVTRLTQSLQFVHVKFDNVTIKRDGTTITNQGTAILTATRLSSNSWVGALSLVSSEAQLQVAGVFTGEVSVLKQVLCKPLL